MIAHLVTFCAESGQTEVPGSTTHYEKTVDHLPPICRARADFIFRRAVCAACAHAAILAQPGLEFHGQIRGPVRGFLPVLLWRLAAEKSYSARPDFLGRLRKAVPGQPDFFAGHSEQAAATKGQRDTV